MTLMSDVVVVACKHYLLISCSIFSFMTIYFWLLLFKLEYQVTANVYLLSFSLCSHLMCVLSYIYLLNTTVNMNVNKQTQTKICFFYEKWKIVIKLKEEEEIEGRIIDPLLSYSSSIQRDVGMNYNRGYYRNIRKLTVEN